MAAILVGKRLACPSRRPRLADETVEDTEDTGDAKTTREGRSSISLGVLRDLCGKIRVHDLFVNLSGVRWRE
jgi:hypothetical protein